MADLTVRLVWQGVGEQFRGGSEGGPQIVIDGANGAGPSPVVLLVLGIGGCMAADVLDITQKMRVPVTSLSVVVDADRRAEPPRRVTKLVLKFLVSGPDRAEESKLWRAIDLSRDKYCSVWHSLREDIELSVEVELQ